MKILYLAHRIPYPPNKGDKIRSYNEVRYLSARHKLDLVCLADESGDLKYTVDLEKLCNSVAVFPLNKTIAKLRGLWSLFCGNTISVGYFHQSAMQQKVDLLLCENHYDAIFCFSSTMAEYVFRSKKLSRAKNKPKLVMDFCDVDSDKWLQYAADARFQLDILYRLESRHLADFEKKIQNEFDRTVLISKAEVDLFKGICPDCETLTVVPNGVDHKYFNPAYQASDIAGSAEGRKLVFTGAMDYHANVDGVLWFCDQIWPRLKARFSELEFYIVGSNPTADVLALNELDGVTVTGFVDDIRDYYAMADVCVVPLRMARGVQNKVLEAMSMGKAVVTTAKANAGIQAEVGQHLLIADSAQDFVAALDALLQNQQQREDLGLSARDFVVSQYDWDKNLQLLEALLS